MGSYPTVEIRRNVQEIPFERKQAGAELDQAQLKLGLGFNSIIIHYIDEQVILLAKLTATNHYLPLSTGS